MCNLLEGQVSLLPLLTAYRLKVMHDNSCYASLGIWFPEYDDCVGITVGTSP